MTGLEPPGSFYPPPKKAKAKSAALAVLLLTVGAAAGATGAWWVLAERTPEPGAVVTAIKLGDDYQITVDGDIYEPGDDCYDALDGDDRTIESNLSGYWSHITTVCGGAARAGDVAAGITLGSGGCAETRDIAGMDIMYAISTSALPKSRQAEIVVEFLELPDADADDALEMMVAMADGVRRACGGFGS